MYYFTCVQECLAPWHHEQWIIQVINTACACYYVCIVLSNSPHISPSAAAHACGNLIKSWSLVEWVTNYKSQLWFLQMIVHFKNKANDPQIIFNNHVIHGHVNFRCLLPDRTETWSYKGLQEMFNKLVPKNICCNHEAFFGIQQILTCKRKKSTFTFFLKNIINKKKKYL